VPPGPLDNGVGELEYRLDVFGAEETRGRAVHDVAVDGLPVQLKASVLVDPLALRTSGLDRFGWWVVVNGFQSGLGAVEHVVCLLQSLLEVVHQFDVRLDEVEPPTQIDAHSEGG